MVTLYTNNYDVFHTNWILNKYKKMTNTTVKKIIKVGEVIPNQVMHVFDGGTGWLNLYSNKFNRTFNEELAKLQDEKYVYNEVCQSKNEEKAFYAAIKSNLLELGYNVTFVKK